MTNRASRSSDDADEAVTEQEATPQKSKKNAPAKYPVSELLDLTDQLIPGTEKFFAVGAIRNSGISMTDEMTTDKFKEIVEAFRNVRAF